MNKRNKKTSGCISPTITHPTNQMCTTTKNMSDIPMATVGSSNVGPPLPPRNNEKQYDKLDGAIPSSCDDEYIFMQKAVTPAIPIPARRYSGSSSSHPTLYSPKAQPLNPIPKLSLFTTEPSQELIHDYGIFVLGTLSEKEFLTSHPDIIEQYFTAKGAVIRKEYSDFIIGRMAFIWANEN